MGKIAYLSIACDTDPDFIVPQQIIYGSNNQNHTWQGILIGIPNFRSVLKQSYFSSKCGQLYVSWLLRSDRQIYELYNDAAFCFRKFENIWSDEFGHNNEIGWHPHLYRWEKRNRQWVPYLGYDDDLKILAECLASLRKCINITTVRMGWDYHSSRLMQFLDAQKIIVDASAISGGIQTGRWFYDWRGSPRFPYQPSICDYRRPAGPDELALNIIEIPTLVRALYFPAHLIRFCKRNIKAIPTRAFTDYKSARWQGQAITASPNSFYQASKQTLRHSLHNDICFINTSFHVSDLLSPKLLSNIICNLNNLSRLAEHEGYNLVSATLRDLAPIAQKWIEDYIQVEVV